MGFCQVVIINKKEGFCPLNFCEIFFSTKEFFYSNRNQFVITLQYFLRLFRWADPPAHDFLMNLYRPFVRPLNNVQMWVMRYHSRPHSKQQPLCSKYHSQENRTRGLSRLNIQNPCFPQSNQTQYQSYHHFHLYRKYHHSYLRNLISSRILLIIFNTSLLFYK